MATKGLALAELTFGTMVERYVVLQRLGVGGMGVVYGAFDTKLERKVALKFIAIGTEEPIVAASDREVLAATVPSASGKHDPPARRGPTRELDERACALLLREAKASAKVRHPNVVPVYDTFVHQRRLYLAMPLVEGMSLRDQLRQRKLAVAQKVRWLSECAGALAAVHRAGLAHGDFKPENVMIDRQGHAMILDFGLAHHLGPTHRWRAAKPNEGYESLTGSPPYVAPELFAGGEVSAKSDVFAWGVVAYEVLCGKRPFVGLTFSQVHRSQRQPTWQDWPAYRRLPSWLRDAIGQALHPEPDRRVADLQALQQQWMANLRAPSSWASVLVGASAALAVAINVGVVAWGQASTATRCEIPSAYAVDPWHDGVKNRVQARFVEVAPQWGREFFTGIDERLRPWFVDWREAYLEGCADMREHVALGQAPTGYDQQIECLMHGFTQVQTVVDGLTHVDKKGIERALATLDQLQQPKDCRDAKGDDGRSAWQADPELAPQVDHNFRVLDDAEISLSLGHEARARTAVKAVEAAARQLTWLPLTGRLLSVKTKMAQHSWAQKSAKQWGTASFIAALATNANLSAFAALHTALVAAGYVHPDVDEQHELAHLLHAMAKRMPQERELLARSYMAFGASTTNLGRHAEGEQWYSRAIALFNEMNAAHTMEAATALASRGSARAMLGDLEGGELDARAALRSMERYYGPNHPALSHAVFSMAYILNAQLRPGEALAYSERGQASVERIEGPTSSRLIPFLDYRLYALRELGRWRAALRQYPRLIELSTRTFGPNVYRTLLIRLSFARAQLAMGNYEACRREVQAVRALQNHDNVARLHEQSAELELLVELRAAERPSSTILEHIAAWQRTTNDPESQWRAHLIAGEAALIVGDHPQLEQAWLALQGVPPRVLDEEFFRGHLLLADMAMMLGDRSSARAHLQHVQANVARRGDLVIVPIGLHTLSMRLAMMQGEYRTAYLQGLLEWSTLTRQDHAPADVQAFLSALRAAGLAAGVTAGDLARLDDQGR